jgi:hypothetical protein
MLSTLNKQEVTKNVHIETKCGKLLLAADLYAEHLLKPLFSVRNYLINYEDGTGGKNRRSLHLGLKNLVSLVHSKIDRD